MDIEFRAWGKNEEEMFYNMENTYDNMTPPFVHINFGELLQDKDYTVEQYTGRKDKNGKKIFAGDIVFNNNCFGCCSSWGDATDNNPSKRIVVWIEKDAKFALAFLEQSIRDRATSGYCFTKSNEDMFEIIGTIHDIK